MCWDFPANLKDRLGLLHMLLDPGMGVPGHPAMSGWVLSLDSQRRIDYLDFLRGPQLGLTSAALI